MDWKDITIKDYEELLNLYRTDKNRFANNAIEYLFKVKNADTTLTLGEYAKYLKELEFFHTQPPKAKLKLSYTIGDGKDGETEYTLKTDIQTFSAVQFQDFTTYNRMPNPSTIDLLSVVLVPKGHFYNDGYDLEEAKEQIGRLSVSDANAIVFFFAIWYQKFVRFLSDYLTREKTLKKIPTETREKISQMLKAIAEITETTE